MLATYDIEINDCKIEDYEFILSRFSNWKKYKREINLNILLSQNKKIQFDVEIINNPMVLYVSVNDDYSHTTSLTNVCSTVNKFTFIILENKILKLKVEVKLLSTKWGTIIKNIIESGLEPKLFQHKNIKGQVDNFYFELPKQAA